MTTAAAKASARTSTIACDVAEQLRAPEEMAACLDAWLAEAPDDATSIARAVGNTARANEIECAAGSTPSQSCATDTLPDSLK